MRRFPLCNILMRRGGEAADLFGKMEKTQRSNTCNVSIKNLKKNV